MTTVPPLVGWSHVALSVTDLDRAVEWYGRVLGFATLFPYDTDAFERRVLAHASGVVVALTAHRTTSDADAFDPVRVGLDHLSLRVEDVAGLAAWADHLDALGIDHGGVQRDAATGSALIAFTDPDGTQLELYVQTGRPTTA